MDAPLAVRARGITKYFGDALALDGADLDVLPGRIHGLAGPNGAGKTTLLGLLLGLGSADGGRLEILGTAVGRASTAPQGVAGFVDGPGLCPSLTARQNLAALAALQGHGRHSAHVEDALDQVGPAQVADERTGGFCLGMRQRLGLAAALLARPRLLVLDEPSNRPAAGTCTACCPPSRPRGPPSCSPATGWTTSKRCAPRSPCWRPGGSSSPVRSAN